MNDPAHEEFAFAHIAVRPSPPLRFPSTPYPLQLLYQTPNLNPLLNSSPYPFRQPLSPSTMPIQFCTQALIDTTFSTAIKQSWNGSFLRRRFWWRCRLVRREGVRGLGGKGGGRGVEGMW